MSPGSWRRSARRYAPARSSSRAPCSRTCGRSRASTSRWRSSRSGGWRSPSSRPSPTPTADDGAPLPPRPEPAQLPELALGGRLGDRERLADAKRPAGRLANLVELDAGMERRQLELAVLARTQDAQVGDHRERAAAAAERGDEVEALDEGARRVPKHDDDLLDSRGDLRRAPGARQPHLRMVVGPDHGRVDVPAPVDLRGAEEADVDPPGSDPVG